MRFLALAGGAAATIVAIGACTLAPRGALESSVVPILDASAPVDATPADAGSDADHAAQDAADARDSAEAGADASDGARADAACSSALFCGGECAATASCNACASGNLQCLGATPRACTATCAGSCAEAPIECYQCGAGATGGTCQPAGTAYCLTIPYAHCPCTAGDPSTCPVSSHVCVVLVGGGAECRTCGEPGTDQGDCRSGKQCDAVASIPSCGN